MSAHPTATPTGRHPPAGPTLVPPSDILPPARSQDEPCPAKVVAVERAVPGLPAPRRAARQVLIAVSVAPTSYLRGIIRYSREHDWHLVTDMVSTGAVPHNWKGDGVLAILPYQSELLEFVQLSGLPCVAFSDADDLAGLAGVTIDHEEIGHLAADHLLERAHRSFAWVPLLDDPANRQRLSGFQDRLALSGCACRVLPPVYRRVGQQWQENWTERPRGLVAELQQLPRPTAIFAYNDCVALDVINACREAGLSVPEDIAVLGVGDSFVCAASPIPLSSIEIDLEEAGYRAAAMLDELMREENPPPVLRVRPRGVVARVSTDVTAVANPRVARALSVIAENYHDPMLSVGVVAEAVGMSRRQLERSVRQTTGCTVNEHIVRMRMKEASRLLKSHPRAKTADVGALVGLTGPGTFFRTFRRFYGMSPKAHRDWTARASVARRHIVAGPHPPLAPAAVAAGHASGGARPTAA